MSKTQTVKITCPKCGEEFDFTYYESINVTLNPELKDSVLYGNVFKAICPKCGCVTTVVHELLYHDMDHKFMIKFDNYPRLLEYKEFLNDLKENDPFFKLTKDTKHIGAATLGDMCSIIVAMEHGLDWRITKIVLHIMSYSYLTYCQNNNKPEPVFLDTHIIEHEGKIKYIAYLKDDDPLLTDFNFDIYEQCLEDFKEILDKEDPFVFDDYIVGHFFNAVIDNEFNHNDVIGVCLVKLFNGHMLTCRCPHFLKGKAIKGELVMLLTDTNKREIGEVVTFVKINKNLFSYDELECARIESIYVKDHMITEYDDSETMDQDKLVEKIKLYKKDDKHHIPDQELKKSKMLLCSKDTISQFGDELVELIKRDKTTGECKEMLSLQKVKRDDKTYLAVYTDLLYLPSDEEKFIHAPLDFDSIARIIKYDPRYDGIIINQYDDNIVFDLDNLYHYIITRTLSHKSELKKLLESLTKEEKESVGDIAYKCFLSFAEGKTPSKEEVAKKYNVKEEKIEKILENGRAKLSSIIYARF